MDPINIDGIDGFIGYLRSIDWSETWLIGLMLVHLLVFCLTILTRNHGNFQAVLFFILLMLVYVSENINEFAARNWRYFSRQQYFDSKGLFISVIFSMPLLINCLLMVCNWLYASGTLMVKLKRAQLRERLRSISNSSREQCANAKGKND